MKRFKNILCIVNTDMQDTIAVEHAAKLAENNQASLTIVEVIDEIPPNTTLFERTLSSIDLQAEIIAEHHNRLQVLVSPLGHKTEIKIKILTGILFLEVIYEVLRNGHDLVFKTAESSVFLNRIFGSDDMHLLRKCPCPVWLVKLESPKAYQTILAAVDVDYDYPSEELNTRHLLIQQILKMASSLAISECAELHIIHAWLAKFEGTIRDAFIARSEEEVASYVQSVKLRHALNFDEKINDLEKDVLGCIKPKKHLKKGDPRIEIPAFAKEIKADLVVMGTVARTGLSGFFMGNTAETILNQLDCSVLAIKPPGFKTPVTLDE